ncbi:hypothetical protein BGW39_005858 [Mortierella sp. 14UC]|nr:hypothetical protein BGW39_005858 [Mortierella sp. 14UC]
MFALFNLRASSRVAPLRRLHTATAPRFNIAFDIDGVLIKGKQVIPQTRRALELLQENKIPYVFLTNGGGMPESEKAEQLTKKMGLYVNPEHLIVSHSPMKSLVPKYENANVLVVGGESSACKHAAHDYGFKNVVTPEEIHSVYPSICPISTCEARAVPWTEKGLENVDKPVDAVMVFHDSNDWGRDLQICLDALVSKGGKLGTIKRSDELHNTKQTVPIYFSNPDIVWANEFPVSRFGQGTFRVCLEKIYENLTGQPLDYITFGKPMKTTYEYAESLFDKIDPLPKGTKRTVYAVGDNPYADIAGATGYGWNSVLVRTGVFKPKGDENHHVHPATTVVDHVGDAVKWIIARENMKK